MFREVHKRRYLLQPMALEVFSGDGRNYLLAFPRKVRNKVYQRFMSMATGIADSAQQSVAGQRRTANVEQATSLLGNLIGETSVTQRWVVRTICPVKCQSRVKHFRGAKSPTSSISCI
jgi:hypothetical protein